MVIFQYNLYIFGIHLWTVLYPKPCYNELCYKEVVVYMPAQGLQYPQTELLDTTECFYFAQGQDDAKLYILWMLEYSTSTDVTHL